MEVNEIPPVKVNLVREELTAGIPERQRSGSKAGSGPDDGQAMTGVA